MFTIHKTSIEDLLLLEPKVFGDDRGYFMETYSQRDFLSAGLTYNFVQDNQSKSRKGVLRGLHFQKNYPQAKLVRVLEGEVFDVAVDLRKGSPTFGKWEGFFLSGENKRMLLIPRDFAHGFAVVSDTAVFTYKCDEFYHPEDEGGIRYDDPTINVRWPILETPLLSEKDKALPYFLNVFGNKK